MTRPRAPRSLTRRLLLVMITALSTLAIGLGAVGSVLIQRIVEQSYDRLLGASLQEIADTVAPEQGNVTFDVPPSAFGMLENEHGDNIYYSVRRGNQLLSGYADLPVVNLSRTAAGIRTFSDASYKGQPVRVAAESRVLPRVRESVIVQVAQTLQERRSLEAVMRSALYALEAVFVLVAGMLIWPTLKWGLRPVNLIREELDARPADHANFEPLDLHNAPTELAGLVSGFNLQLKRLESAVAGVRQFTADASHQMRTPLAVLKTHVAVLDHQVAANAAAASSLADVKGAVTRLESLLTRLTTLARADEAVRGGIVRSRIDLRDIITQVTSELLPLAYRHEVTLSAEIAPRPAWVNAEPVLAAEILTNLLDNAICYNQPGGKVDIAVQHLSDAVVLSVEDDGPGVPPSELKHIGERFFRLPRDQGKPGTGLGLSIVRSLSEALHAQFSIETPASGRGLRASVRFEPAS